MRTISRTLQGAALLAVLCLALAAPPPVHAQGIQGQAVDLSCECPIRGRNVLDSSTFNGSTRQAVPAAGLTYNVGPDVKVGPTSLTLSGRAPTTMTFWRGIYFPDGVTATPITYYDSPTWPAFPTASTGGTPYFSGIVLTQTGPAPVAFGTFTVGASSTLAGFSLSRVSVSGGVVAINLVGLAFNPGDTLTLDFTTGAVVAPSPAVPPVIWPVV